MGHLMGQIDLKPWRVVVEDFLHRQQRNGRPSSGPPMILIQEGRIDHSEVMVGSVKKIPREGNSD